MEMSI